MKKYLLFLIFSISFSLSCSSQEFIFKLMEKADAKQIKLKDASSIASRFFDSAGTDRETGYKHFQRWLYEKQFHVDDNGYVIDPETEWETWKNTTPPNTGFSINGRSASITWNEMGPWGWTYTSSWNPGTGRLTDIAIHPADTTKIYVTSPGGGTWKSTNSGNTWVPLQDFNATWMNMFCITIDPLNQNVIYAGNGSGSVEKSTNAGTSWTTLSAGASGTVREIVIHPTNSNIVFVCSSNGIRRSTDAGITWTSVFSTQIEDLEFKTDNPNIIVAVGNSSVIRSTDNGLSWTTLGATEGITLTGRRLVSVSPANPNVFYIVQANGSEFGRFYRSNDAGLTFTTTIVGSSGAGTNFFGYTGGGTGGQATYDMAMAVSPFNADEVYIAGIIVWSSTNGGSSFVQQTVWSYPNGTGYNHADVHGLQWINNTLYSNSDGGIYKTNDRGDNWTDLSTGLGIRQFYRIACSQTDANVITGGAQDNGSVTRKPAGNWVDWLGADGMEGLVSPTNPNNLWGTSQNGSIYRSTNGGNSYSGLSKPSNGNWVTPLGIHPTNPNTLYGGWTGFYKSTNGGVNWTLLSGTTIIGTVTDFAVAPSDTNYLYVSQDSRLYVSTDAGLTWTTTFLTNTISDICVHRTIPTKVYITYSSSSNNVLVSTNAGASFTTISTGLPSVAARSIAIENNPLQGIYVGMNTGVYYKNDTMSTWLNYSGNLPTVAVNELEIQYAASRLRLATYGRGVWDIPLFGVSVLPVKWLSFNGTLKDNGIQLNWKVSGETVQTKYELQRSYDGVNFTTIHHQISSNQSTASYNYVDINNTTRDVVYYRVKEIEGARIRYSIIISIRLSKRISKLQIKPNPIYDGLLRFDYLVNNDEVYEINILAMDGKVMMIHKLKGGKGQMDISKLQNGMYQLLIKQGNEITSERFVKSN